MQYLTLAHIPMIVDSVLKRLNFEVIEPLKHSYASHEHPHEHVAQNINIDELSLQVSERLKGDKEFMQDICNLLEPNDNEYASQAAVDAAVQMAMVAPATAAIEETKPDPVKAPEPEPGDGPIITKDTAPEPAPEPVAEAPVAPPAEPAAADEAPAEPATEPEVEPEPTATAGQGKELDIVALAAQAKADISNSREAFGRAMQEAYGLLIAELDTNDLWFNIHGAEFVDQATDFSREAFLHLRIEIAKRLVDDKKGMTPSQAIAFAREYDAKHNTEDEEHRWLFQARIYPPLRDAFREKGLELKRFDPKSGADLHEGLSNLARSGQMAVEDIVKMADESGWAFRPKRTNPSDDFESDAVDLGGRTPDQRNHRGGTGQPGEANRSRADRRGAKAKRGR